ncbi:MAG: hypothetical protein LBK00_04070 [Treponema sp.]|jgi:hypothetical protein|nr:hypothetical protein [Treponema sp.]
MNVYKPLRVALFVYELFRLLILLGVFVVVPILSQPFETFPFLLYIVPNALFPLMAFFLLLDFFYYIPYLSLYMAGKTIAVVSIIGWYVTGAPMFDAIIIGASLFIALFDALSILGECMIQKKYKQLMSRTTSSADEYIERGGL